MLFLHLQNEADIALTVKLQQKLKDMQAKKERLERQLEAAQKPEGGGGHDSKHTGDLVKVRLIYR